MKVSSKALVLFGLLLCASAAGAQTATVTWNNVHQTIDGFGAATGGAAPIALSSSQADLFFSPTAGIGLSILRVTVPDDGSCSGSCNFADNATIQEALARGVSTVFATPWSPPASMKTNGSVDNGGSLSSGSYAAYASYLSNYATQFQSTYGISLYALSVQNEPDVNAGYDSAIWSAQNFHDFIRNNLGPTFATNGVKAKIMMPEPDGYADFTNYAGTTMNDSSAAAYVGVLAFHGYDNSFSISNPYSGSQHFWETEVSDGNSFGPSLCGGCWDPSIGDALMWAGIIHYNIAVANENAWNWWWLIDYYNSDNEGLIGPDGVTVSKRTYAIGNFSKFVRPGWVRIDATASPANGVQVSAYKDPVSGNFAIVAINENGSDTAVNFNLSGFVATSVTPWVTSGSLNLAQQTNISFTGNTFSDTLPASSITTFVGSSNGAGAPTPPTITQIITR